MTDILDFESGSYNLHFYIAMGARYTNPSTTLNLLRHILDVAEREGNDPAALFIKHWILQVQLTPLQDYGAALDLAVKTAVEARKPIYRHLDERICVHEDLISTYLGIDPDGYADLIEGAIDYMQGEVQPGMQCRLCLQALRGEFEVTQARYAAARQTAERLLEMCEGDVHGKHHGTYAYADLCEVAFYERDWRALRDNALAGEDMSGGEERLLSPRTVFMAALAVALHQLGVTDEAARHAQRAVHTLRTTTYPLATAINDMLCSYYEQVGDVATALALRDQQVGRIGDKLQPARLAHAHIERILSLIHI